jgi:hypothetical protein
MSIIKIYHDKKWTLQFLDALYNSIDIDVSFGRKNRIKISTICQLPMHLWCTIKPHCSERTVYIFLTGVKFSWEFSMVIFLH